MTTVWTEDDEDEDEVLEEDNGRGQEEEEEEEEEEQHPFQQDHADVSNVLDLLNRSVTPPPPPRILVILCLVNLRNRQYSSARSARLAQWYTSPPRPTRSCGGTPPRWGVPGSSDLFTMTVRHQGMMNLIQLFIINR